MIKQTSLPLAARLARSVALSGTAAIALGGFAGQAHASPQVSSASVTNGSLVITLDDAGHTVDLALSAGNPNILLVTTDRRDVQAFDRTQFTQIFVTGGQGDDTVTIGNGFADEQVTVDGGAGNDTITSGDGNDLLLGGSGNDTITGGKGKDVALLGSGSDSFIWNPGDGSDTVDGQRGFDTMVFNGAAAAEHMTVSANGSQSVLTRDVGTITMNMNSIEGLDLNTLGGADLVEVGDLTGTGLAHVNVGLEGPDGIRDGAADEVVVSGTEGNDHIKVGIADGGGATVRGLHPSVNITGADPSLDRLQINALGGRDKANVDANEFKVIQVSVDLGDQQSSNREPNDDGVRTDTQQSTN
jgi:Ca2+-binding RTX toxin-like protein